MLPRQGGEVGCVEVLGRVLVKVPMDMQQQEFVIVPQVEYVEVLGRESVQVQIQELIQVPHVPVKVPVGQNKVPIVMQQQCAVVPQVEFVEDRIMGLGSGASNFRVVVPKPHLNVQYRRTQNLEDRHTKYAVNGMMVTGHVEEDGEWLRIREGIFLPMRLGTIQILEPLPLQVETVELIVHDPEQLQQMVVDVPQDKFVEALVQDPVQLQNLLPVQVPVPVVVPSRLPVKGPTIMQKVGEVPQVEVDEVIVPDPASLRTQVLALHSVIKCLEADGDVHRALLPPLRRQLTALLKALKEG